MSEAGLAVCAAPLRALLGVPPSARPPRPAPPDTKALEAARAEARAEANATWAAEVAALRLQLANERASHESATRQHAELAAASASAIEARFADALASLSFTAMGVLLAAKPPIAEATLRSLIAEATAGLPRGTLFVAADVLAPCVEILPPGWEVATRDDLAPGVVEAECGPALQRASLSARLAQLLDLAP